MKGKVFEKLYSLAFGKHSRYLLHHKYLSYQINLTSV